MFNEQEILKFVKKIIIKEENLEKATNLINEFKEYLDLTKMATDEILNKLDKIILSLPHIYALNKVLNEDDINELLNIFDKTENLKNGKIKQKIKIIENKHYDQFGLYESSANCNNSRSVSSSSCGSYNYSSSCGNSNNYGSSYNYSSGCGGGSSIYTSRGC